MTKTDFAFCAAELARLAEIAERHQHDRLARLLTLAGKQARDGEAAKSAAQGARLISPVDDAPSQGPELKTGAARVVRLIAPEF